MARHRPARPDDYARLPDGELIRRMRDRHDPRAEEVLGRRYARRIARAVLRVARRLGVPADLWDDALQEALFHSLREAVAAFPESEAGDRFVGLLLYVVTTDTQDLARRLRREEAHYCRLRPGAAGAPPAEFEPVAVGADPAELAERHELVERLQQVLDRLGPEAQDLADRRAAGQSVHAAAEGMGWGYRRAQRLWRRIVEVVQREFPDFPE